MVLPLDSGPKISTTRPLGIPCPPKAMSSDRLPVEMPVILAHAAGAQGHDGPFAELFLDLGDGRFQRGMGVQHGGRAVWAGAGALAAPRGWFTAFLAIDSFAFVLLAETM